MDGLRPMEELSEAPQLCRVLRFAGQHEADREFTVNELIDPTATSLVTVARLRSDDDEPDQRSLRDEEDWKELFQEMVPPSAKNEELDGLVSSNTNPRSRLLLVILRAETETTAPREVDTLEAGSLHASTPEAINPRSTAIGAQSVVSRFFSDCKNAVAASASFLAGARRVSRKSARDGKVWPETDVGIPLSTIKYQRNLRNVPFTSAMFRFIVKRMSIHHWILRLVSRANVPAFERTVTEMPLYSANGESMGPEKSIIYNCRTTNDWEDDMALSVTHFPAQKVTFALLLGPSRAQERSILARLRKAGADTAHPMLLPGIVAELERLRQMNAVDEAIEEMEVELSQLDAETVAAWQQSIQTKAQRNRKKAKALLDTIYSKNVLLANAALLSSMSRHLWELPGLINPAATRKYRYLRRSDPDSPDFGIMRPGTPHSSGSTVYNFAAQNQSSTNYKNITGLETLTWEPDSMLHDREAEYQDTLRQASQRMKDRISTMIREYDDKIRMCTMEIDGMRMATQWSHGETNMEIAAASGEDSSQMRSIALVTMVFLPGTFFASMFSMTFFDWSPDSNGDHPIGSSRIWIYFFFTVVFTGITLLLFWCSILSRQRKERPSFHYV